MYYDEVVTTDPEMPIDFAKLKFKNDANRLLFITDVLNLRVIWASAIGMAQEQLGLIADTSILADVKLDYEKRLGSMLSFQRRMILM